MSIRFVKRGSTVEKAASGGGPVSRKVGPDLYELTVVDANGMFQDVQGHWRTVHGHRLFLAEDGTFYTRNKWGDYAASEAPPWMARHIEEYPEVVVRPADGSDYEYVVDGLTIPVAEKALEMLPTGKRYKDARQWMEGWLARWKAAEALLPAGEDAPPPHIGGGAVGHIALVLPNVAYGKELRYYISGDSKAMNSPDEAKRAQASWAIAIGADRPEYEAWEAARLGERRAEREATEAAKAAGMERLANFPITATLWAMRQSDSDRGFGHATSAQSKIALRIVAAWLDAGLVEWKESYNEYIRTRRANPALNDESNPQNTREMAAMLSWCFNAYPGDAEDYMHTLPPAREYALKRCGELVYSAMQQARWHTGRGGTVNGKRIDESISHNIFENLAKRPDLARKVAQDDPDAEEQITPEGMQRDIDAMLAAQEDDRFTPPPLLTMAGYREADGSPGRVLPHQAKGINWAIVAKRGLNGFGTGTGKTLIAIATALKLNAMKKTKMGVILVPNATMHGWAIQCRKAAPNAKVVVLDASNASRARLRERATNEADIVIMGQSTMVDPTGQFSKWIAGKDCSVQVDEPHKSFRNPASLPFRNLKAAIDGKEYAIGLTATPIPNYNDAFWEVMNLFRPGAAGDKDNFRGRRDVNDLGSSEDTRRAVLARMDSIRTANKPWLFFKSRNDPDVQVFVPPHVNIDSLIDPPDGWDELTHWIGEYASEHYRGWGIASQAMMMQRQACISPALLQSRRFPDLYDGYSEEAARAKGIEDYTGPEPKIDACIDEIRAFHDDPANVGKSFIVACSFTEGLDRVRVRLKKDLRMTDSDIVEISGNESHERRGLAEDRLNGGTELRRRYPPQDMALVGLLSIQAGGTGLNLNGDEQAGTGPTAMFRLNEEMLAEDNTQLIERISRPFQPFPTTSWMPRIEGSVETLHIMPLVAGKQVIADALRSGLAGLEEAMTGTGASLEAQLELLHVPPDRRAEILASDEAKREREKREAAARQARIQARREADEKARLKAEKQQEEESK